MDAMVMGWRDAQPGRLTSQPHHTTSTDSEGQPRKQQQHAPAEGRDGSAALSSGGPSVLLELGAPLSSTLTMQMGPDDFEFDAELTPIKAARPRAVRRIFATTYNMVRCVCEYAHRVCTFVWSICMGDSRVSMLHNTTTP